MRQYGITGGLVIKLLQEFGFVSSLLNALVSMEHDCYVRIFPQMIGLIYIPGIEQAAGLKRRGIRRGSGGKVYLSKHDPRRSVPVKIGSNFASSLRL